MKRYLAQTVITMLQALTLILMAPIFLGVCVAVAIGEARRRSVEWITLHGFYSGDEQAKRKADWRAS